MSGQRSWFSSHPPVMTKGGVPEAPPPTAYTGYQMDSQLPQPPSMPADPNVGHHSDRILVPRKWTGGYDKKHQDDNDDDDNSENEEESHGTKKDQGGKDKRGNYKCGRCGEPKKGHICRNKPRLRTAVVETCDSEAQVELEPSHTVRSLSLHIQGYPESYGLTYTWTGMPFPQYGGRATILPPYIPHIQSGQMPQMMGGGGGPQYPVQSGGGQPYPSMGMGGGQQGGMMMPPGAQTQPPPPQLYMPGQGGGQQPSKSHRQHHSQGQQQDVYGGTPPTTQQYYA